MSRPTGRPNADGLFAVDVRQRREASWRDLFSEKRADELVGTIYLPAYPRIGDRIHVGQDIFEVLECHWLWFEAADGVWMNALVRAAGMRAQAVAVGK